MAKSKAEIVQSVGEELGLTPVGQALEAQHSIKLSDTFDIVYAGLKEQGLAFWAETANVPTRFCHYMVILVAEKSLTSYSVPETRYQRIKIEAGDDGILAKLKLAKVGQSVYQGLSEPEDF